MPLGRYWADMIWQKCVVFEHVRLCWISLHLLRLSWKLSWGHCSRSPSCSFLICERLGTLFVVAVVFVLYHCSVVATIVGTDTFYTLYCAVLTSGDNKPMPVTLDRSLLTIMKLKCKGNVQQSKYFISLIEIVLRPHKSVKKCII